MIEREEKDGVWDEKKKAFGVFIFSAKKIIKEHKIRQYLFIAQGNTFFNSQLIINFFPCISDSIFLLVSCIWDKDTLRQGHFLI